MLNSAITGRSVSPRKARRWQAALDGVLAPGEVVFGLFQLDKLKPMTSALVITNARIFGLEPTKASAVTTEASRSTVKDVFIRDGVNLGVQLASGDELKYGYVKKADVDDIRAVLARGFDQHLAASLDAASASVPEPDEASAARAALDAVSRGSRLYAKQAEEILACCREGELPVFVISTGMAGALAAFEDRCIIVKAGGLSGYMAGASFGGRVSTFYFTDITGVEYNAGLLNGVLEILTPSYQGTANKDFWRGTTKGRNADSNDPWTLSNTLPLSKHEHEQVRPEIERLHEMIVTAKRPVPGAPPAPPADAAGRVADEIRKLAELHAQAILDDDEFATAKARLLARLAV